MSHAVAGTRDELVDAALRRVVGQRLLTDRAVTSIRRRRCEYASSYAAHVVTVRLAGGAELVLFEKDFGVCSIRKDGADDRRHREVAVYRELLRRAPLGQPEYFGAVMDDASDVHCLFIEYVQGSQLSHLDASHWRRAVGWLGRLQGHFAGQGQMLRACGFLARHDADFYRAQAAEAAREIGGLAPHLAPTLSLAIRSFERLADAMAVQPATLVHGDFRPSNILAAIPSDPMRMCPVDWERAALGSAYFDVAFLTDGFEGDALRDMLLLFRDEAQRAGAVVAGVREMVFLTHCFQLLRTFIWLSRAGERGFSRDKMDKLVNRAEFLRRQLRGSHALA